MKSSLYLIIALALFLRPFALLAETGNLFFSMHYGNASSSGPFEMNEFYDPSSSIAVELGYRLNDYFAIVPVHVAFHNYSFNQAAYAENYQNYQAQYRAQLWEKAWEQYSEINVSNNPFEPAAVEASSNLESVAYTPGVVLHTPRIAGFNAFGQFGAGIYSTKVSMEHIVKSVNIYDPSQVSYGSYREKTRISHFALLFGGGLEYFPKDFAGIFFRVSYYRVFTGRKSNPELGYQVLKFYRLDNETLRYHRFLEEKDTGILELSAGFKILMY
ncbi:MAG: hypothetical protein FVQ81_15325 [Candidatus Glassbacteria bacterium]|nr:hypothetical protein [Candidatus Glassbacteria bacterium]